MVVVPALIFNRNMYDNLFRFSITDSFNEVETKRLFGLVFGVKPEHVLVERMTNSWNGAFVLSKILINFSIRLNF